MVDTGLHSQHWTRQQAMDYFRENSAKTEQDIVVEVDRYISWPGQALAYKMGQLKIKELRDYATGQLGPKFDVREFHDHVLDGGALPLDIAGPAHQGLGCDKKERQINPFLGPLHYGKNPNSGEWLSRDCKKALYCGSDGGARLRRAVAFPPEIEFRLDGVSPNHLWPADCEQRAKLARVHLD